MWMLLEGWQWDKARVGERVIQGREGHSVT